MESAACGGRGCYVGREEEEKGRRGRGGGEREGWEGVEGKGGTAALKTLKIEFAAVWRKSDNKTHYAVYTLPKLSLRPPLTQEGDNNKTSRYSICATEKQVTGKL